MLFLTPSIYGHHGRIFLKARTGNSQQLAKFKNAHITIFWNLLPKAMEWGLSRDFGLKTHEFMYNIQFFENVFVLFERYSVFFGVLCLEDILSFFGVLCLEDILSCFCVLRLKDILSCFCVCSLNIFYFVFVFVF